ncbi:MAG: CAP domain-containing protein [Xanthomonadales bacterium]|jgi:uncharacterized protein YkwD|nr:CAP domain-containing protein [Xanthomonadales bacterium]
MIKSRFFPAFLLLCASASPALAEITFNIEEPVQDSTRSGIGLVSGWAVSDLGIESVEVFMDGERIGFVPYGSGRGDVGAAFPDIPGSDFSGWGMKWGYGLTPEGEHTLRIVVTEQGGGTASREVTFNTIRFNTEFISDPADVVTAGASIESPVDGRLVITGAEVMGEMVDIELVWDTGSQQFLIDTIIPDGTVKSEQTPTAMAGSDLTAEAGSSVSVTGAGSDPDGHIVSHSWSQVSGPSVTLQDSDQWTVNFTAPATAGDIRLRLQVTDDDGLTGSDDVIIEVIEANRKPEVSAGSDLTVNVGETVNITGSGSDSDGEIVSWNWSRIGGLTVSLQNASTQTVRFTAPASAGYTRLRLRVTDDDGASDYDDVVVNFVDPTPANQAPTANAGADQDVDAGDTVSITGSGTDSDGTIVSWAWSQVSGASVSLSGANSQTVGFTAPDSATTIRLRLTVTDDDGATDTDDVLVTVKETVSQTVTGDTVYSMLDNINAARGTTRFCGDTEYPAQPALQWSASLAEIAMIHSMDMAAKGYFSHTSADGTSMGDRVFPYWNAGYTVGENIAASSIDRDDQYVTEMWLNSEGHCKLIMSPNFTHAGIGVGRDPNNGYTYHHFWTLDFGG